MCAAAARDRPAMSGWDVAGALLAAALLVYLVAALLRPEDWS
jgi:K+-transporting ATPase KdpF subunit